MQEKIYNSSHELLESLKFCVIDLETTGGNPDTEKIIEVGILKIENRKITEERSFLINPEKEIPDFVQKLTEKLFISPFNSLVSTLKTWPTP